MRIAIVLNTSWNIYNFRLGLIKTLLNKGIEVHAIAPEDTYSSKLVEAGCVYHPLKMDSRGINPIRDLALVAELFSIYRSIRPDIILHYTVKPNIYGTLAASMLRIPVINNVCGLGTAFLDKNLISRLVIQLYRIAFRFPRKIFFQNEQDLKFFLSKKIVRKDMTDLIPGSGIDPEVFKPAGFHRNKKFTFLLISRLIHDKGIVEYVDAVRQLRESGLEARFQILGPIDEGHRRGIPEQTVRTWIDSGLVEYLGTTEDVRPFIHDADCVVLPSYREGTPRTLLEAASSGKPIVATDVPGCTNVVKDKYNGFLCRKKDPSDLAKKMDHIYNLPDSELKTLGKNGRQLIVTRFDEKLVISKYLDNIQALSA